MVAGLRRELGRLGRRGGAGAGRQGGLVGGRAGAGQQAHLVVGAVRHVAGGGGDVVHRVVGLRRAAGHLAGRGGDRAGRAAHVADRGAQAVGHAPEGPPERVVVGGELDIGA